jgi:hypothetical protein
VTAPKSLVDVKRKLSDTLLNVPGVTGVGLRGDRIVVYLETHDAATQRKVERLARAAAPNSPVILEVTGPFSKQ